MKRLNFLSWMICSILLFISCSKDDPASSPEEETTATLSFGAVLNDLVANRQHLKQSMADIPACSDAMPSYVAVVLSGTTSVGSMEDPLIVALSSTPGDYDNDGEDEYFTLETPDLELEPGPYSLDFFAVYDEDDHLIWLAPTEGGDLAGWVTSLPLEFNLQEGSKKYLDVDVLCYDNRFLNRYGYLFFRIQGTEVMEFCLYGNVCDESGRHSPAGFQFDVWTYSGNPANPQGMPVFSENNPFINNVGTNDEGEPYADPLCLYLPGTTGEDIYYGEIYLLENGSRRMIRSGQFTDADVRLLFDGDDNLDYFHFREGCGGFDSPNIFGAGGVPGEVVTIADYINSSQNYTLLSEALEITGLVSILTETNDYTLFAPDNDAFEHYLGMNGFSSLEEIPTEVLTELLLYHVQPGIITTGDFSTGYMESMATAIDLDETLSIFINTSNGIVINGEAEVIEADMEMENGIIHVVSHVIGLPTLWTFISADPKLSHLEDAYLSGEQDFQVPGLRQEGARTLLANSNAGWEAFFEFWDITHPEEINVYIRHDILEHNRLIYSNLRSEDFWDGELDTVYFRDSMLTLTLGDPITVTDRHDRTFEFEAVDIQANNGVIHIINGVLLP